MGQWSQSMVRSVVQVCGLVSGPVGDPVGNPVRSVVWSMVQFVVQSVRSAGPSKHVLLHTTACQLQMLGYWSRKRACVLLFPSSGQLGVPYY